MLPCSTKDKQHIEQSIKKRTAALTQPLIEYTIIIYKHNIQMKLIFTSRYHGFMNTQ